MTHPVFVVVKICIVHAKSRWDNPSIQRDDMATCDQSHVFQAHSLRFGKKVANITIISYLIKVVSLAYYGQCVRSSLQFRLHACLKRSVV